MNLPVIFASSGVATTEVNPLSGWDNLGFILTKPDNVPILMMIIMFTFFTYLAMRDAFRNDRLVKQGRKADILKQMQE